MMNHLVSMNRHFRITMFFILIIVSFIMLLFTGNMFFWFTTFLFIVLLIASNVSHARHTLKTMKQSLPYTLNKLKFRADSSYLSDDFFSAIGINKEESKLVILTRENVDKEFTYFLYNFDDILECSIKEDGATITKTVKSSAISNAIAGEVLFGGIGATIGGLSGKKISSEKINKMTLSIVVNDLEYPVHEIHFLNSNLLIDKNSATYNRIYENLNKWHKIISVIIKRNEMNSKTV